ncbi:MAG: hypothetical protein ACI9XO_003818 [Paraglaciecola sp.]|jgi:hypothetical protein
MQVCSCCDKGILRDKNGFAKTIFVPQNPTRAGAGSAHGVFQTLNSYNFFAS